MTCLAVELTGAALGCQHRHRLARLARSVRNYLLLVLGRGRKTVRMDAQGYLFD